MFIVFNTKSQAKNYIKRNKHLNYNHHEGCGCCFFHNSLFFDGNKLVSSNVVSQQGGISASAIVIGKIKKNSC